METKKKSIRAQVVELERGECFSVPIGSCKPHTLRGYAHEIALITGNTYRVNLDRANHQFIVTRTH